MRVQIQRVFSRARRLDSSHYLSRHKAGLKDTRLNPQKIQNIQQTLSGLESTQDLNQSFINKQRKDDAYQHFLHDLKSKKEWKHVITPEESMQRQVHILEEIRQRKAMGHFLHEGQEQQTGSKLEHWEANPTQMLLQQHQFAQNLDLKTIIDPSQFSMIMLDQDAVTNVTTLNRINKRRCLLYLGNTDGIVGYGKGKAGDYMGAFNAAVENALNNLISIKLDPIFQVPFPMYGKHNSWRIWLLPAPGGHFIGDPQIYNMLVLAGITNIRYYIAVRNRNPYSMVYAFFNAIRQNQTWRDRAEWQREKKWVLEYHNRIHYSNNTLADARYNFQSFKEKCMKEN